VKNLDLAHRGRAVRTGFAIAFRRGARRRDENARGRASPTEEWRHGSGCRLRRRLLYGSTGPLPGPSGRVYAEDISDGQLSKLKQHLGEEGLRNVEVIKGALDDPKPPKKEVLDGALIVNTYHEMTDHEAMLRHVISALKPGGVLVLMDGMWDEHEARSREEVEKAGFEVAEVRDPFIERAPDRDGKSRWWAIIARRPAHYPKPIR
jgi:SAM-dependent methyltransferase